MPQRPKSEVRDALLTAAVEAFARHGFERTTLSEVVSRAGTSIGNLYRYFANKDELFAAAIPAEFALELMARVRAQVGALQGEVDVYRLPEDHPYRRAAAELLGFTIAHRARVVFLLVRAQGTAHAAFAGALVDELVALALVYAGRAYPDSTVTRVGRRALERVYAAFVTTLGRLLEEEHDEDALREAIALHGRYHLTGLAALFASMGES